MAYARFRASAGLVLATLLAACQSPSPDAPRGYVFHVPLGATFELAQGRVLDDAEQMARLRGVRLLLLGEHHEEPASHRAQLDLLRRLPAQGRAVTVALEMFPPSADPALEAWRLGTLSEAEFLERSGWYASWGYPWAYYRELFLWCRDRRIPLFGVNADAAARTAARLDKLQDLPPAAREEVGDLHGVLEPHRDLLLDTLRQGGHSGDLTPESAQFQGFLRVQTLWDRLMGQRAARLAAAQPAEGIVVLLIGSGHLAYKLGANLQAARIGAVASLSLWDDAVSPEDLDSQGRARVPVGIADWARVYLRDPEHLGYPTLTGVKLVSTGRGVQVESVSQFADPWLKDLRAGDLMLALNGQPMATPAQLRLAAEALPWDRPSEWNVEREGHSVPLQLRPHPARR
jgi:uncharacterized iron-regulated protein